MIYGQTKDVLAAGWLGEMDGWMGGWMGGWMKERVDGRMVRGMDGDDDGSLPCIQALF